MGSGLLWSVAVPSQLSPSFPPPWIPVNSCIRGISTTSATLFFFSFLMLLAPLSTGLFVSSEINGWVLLTHTFFLLSVMLVLRIHLINL